MPTFEDAEQGSSPQLQFPPVTRDHILHCSYDYWHPKYRTSCIRSRIIPVTPEFVDYIREDGIRLSDEGDDEDGDDAEEEEEDPEYSDSDSEPAAPRIPPNKRFPELHQRIKDEIAALGGAVHPKLNWSSPKDAAWMLHNTLKCQTPDDIYLLLKSSNFVGHDIEHAFEDCVSPPAPPPTSPPPLPPPSTDLGFQPVLVLRRYFEPRTALEFRAFVKHRNLIGISARDMQRYEFLGSMRKAIAARVRELFEARLQFTFPEGCFTFDVYIPEAAYVEDEEGEFGTLGRARLIDINPWAPRTDSLLFGWRELLERHVPRPILGSVGEIGPDVGADEGEGETAVRIPLRPPGPEDDAADATDTTDDDSCDEDEEEEDELEVELRLVEEGDVAGLNLASPQYSAHRMPKDIVDASAPGAGGLGELAQEWREWQDMVARTGR